MPPEGNRPEPQPASSMLATSLMIALLSGWKFETMVCLKQEKERAARSQKYRFSACGAAAGGYYTPCMPISGVSNLRLRHRRVKNGCFLLFRGEGAEEWLAEVTALNKSCAIRSPQIALLLLFLLLASARSPQRPKAPLPVPSWVPGAARLGSALCRRRRG